MKDRKLPMPVALLGVCLALFGDCSCSGTDSGDAPKATAERIIDASRDPVLTRARAAEDFKIVEAKVLRNGVLLCGSRSGSEDSAMILSKDGRLLYYVRGIIWAPGYPTCPFVGSFRPGDQSEQIVIPVPLKPYGELVELRIIDFSEGPVKSQTLTRFSCGYAEDGKALGVYPAVRTVGGRREDIILVRKSSDPLEAPEVVERVTWDQDSGRFHVTRFSNRALAPPYRARNGETDTESGKRGRGYDRGP